MHIELPSGNTVEVRERVTNGQRKRYYEAIENAREREAEVPVLKIGADGEVELDGHGNPVVLKDDEGRTIYQTRKIVPIAASMDTLDVLMGMLIDSWSFGLPLPAEQPDVLDELEVEDYDELSEAVKPLLDKMRPSFKVSPDAESPTEPSSE